METLVDIGITAALLHGIEAGNTFRLLVAKDEGSVQVRGFIARGKVGRRETCGMTDDPEYFSAGLSFVVHFGACVWLCEFPVSLCF